MPSDAPLFSIVIPTRNRAHLLRYALRSALEQEFDDYEIVVVANDCSDGTRDVVQEMHDARIRYFETPTMLSMPDNWDFAWTKARGEYLTYLSDDDALVPSALGLLEGKAMSVNAPIVTWEDATYYYPNWHDENLRNLLLIFYRNNELIDEVSTASFRRMCARFEFPWQSTLPKMLNCIVQRQAFEPWRARLGRLFPPICPDYSFAWIACHLFESVRVVHRPLSIRGISDGSRGSNAGLGDAGKEFLSEFDGLDFSGLPTRVPTTMNLIAATYLRTNAMLSDQGIVHEPFDRAAYLKAVAKQLRERESEDLLADPSRYFPELLADAASISDELHEAVDAILSAPSSAGSAAAEGIRDVRRRTASMALEYAPTLANMTVEHLGDDTCARCVLGLADGVLADAAWESLYVFGDEIGVSDPYGASQHVDRFYDLLTTCRGKQQQALELSSAAAAAATAGERPEPVALPDISPADRPDVTIVSNDAESELRAKEQIIDELRATADERLRLLNEASAEASRARVVAEQLVDQLHEKVQLISSLAASADERLDLVDQANADALKARTVAEQLIEQLQEKERLIASLTASADQRLDLAERANADALQARTVTERLVQQLEEKDLLIASLTASADERLAIAEHANADALQARTVAQRLVEQLQERDQLIASVNASADERLRLLEQAHADAANARAVAEQLLGDFLAKDQVITSLAASADERLRLIDRAHADAEQSRATVIRLRVQLQEKDEAIMSLAASADERLRMLSEVTASADERLRLLHEALASADDRLRLVGEVTTAAAAEREALTAELVAKEQEIVTLTTAANERLQLAEQASLDAAQSRAAADLAIADAAEARAALEQLQQAMHAKEQVIQELIVAASERLELIQRLHLEMMRNGPASEPEQP